MIVAMKKVALITLEKEREEALNELRSLGVMHLERSTGDVSSKEYSRIETNLKRVDLALATLPPETHSKAVTCDRIEAEELLNSILDMEKEMKALEEELLHIHHKLDILADWDNIDPNDLILLREKGIDLRLYSIPEKDFNDLNDTDGLVVLNHHKGSISLLSLNKAKEDLPPWEEVELPEENLSQLNDRTNQINMTLAQLAEKLTEAASRESLLTWLRDQFIMELQWEEAKLRFQEDDNLVYISGFVPSDAEESLKEKAKNNQWALVLQEPKEEEAVPTKLKVGRFSSLLMPVMDFLGILPGYRELDISMFFLIFFTIFTAMLIGDAGYGFIFLAVALGGIAVTAVKKKPIHKGLVLLLLLSFGTIGWGMVTGTWFASKALMEIPLLQRLKLPFFTGTDDEMITVIMGVSFLLGVVQLCLGIVQGFIFEFPKLKSIARIGWLAVMIAIYSLILTLVIDRNDIYAYPTPMLYLLLAGVALIFLFGAQEKGQNFFKGVGKAFANFLQNFLDVVGTFSNLMSYVRLFAVGLASVKIAETFNVLAKDMAEGWTIIFAVLIIVLGHTLNIILGLMAILVHAVRLNILEYSGQIGIEWSGFKYEPFKVHKS